MSGINLNIWSVIILLGAVQGLLLSIYLFTRVENKSPNRWLAFLLLVVSLHLLEYTAAISEITLKYPILISITYPLLFCMGPLYFFYCRHLLDNKTRTTFKTLLHFIPALLVLLLMLPFYLMPASDKIAYMQGLSIDGNLNVPIEQLVFMAVHVIQTIVYVWISLKFIRKTKEELKKVSSHTITIKKLEWLQTFSFYFSIYLLLYLALVMILFFIKSYQVEIDYVMVFITSFSLYAIGYVAIGNPEIFSATQEVQSVLKKNGSSTRNENQFPELKEQLLLYMETHKPYLKSDLRISELADSLSVPYYQLSQLINDEFSVNFYDFVNQYRVEEAKRLLIEDTRNFKILAIAYEVGFNSKATFNRVFKKVTNHTPSEFKKKFSQSQS